MVARQLTRDDGFVDAGGFDRVGDNSDAGEQVKAARAGRREDQAHQAELCGWIGVFKPRRGRDVRA